MSSRSVIAGSSPTATIVATDPFYREDDHTERSGSVCDRSGDAPSTVADPWPPTWTASPIVTGPRRLRTSGAPRTWAGRRRAPTDPGFRLAPLAGTELAGDLEVKAAAVQGRPVQPIWTRPRWLRTTRPPGRAARRCHRRRFLRRVQGRPGGSGPCERAGAAQGLHRVGQTTCDARLMGADCVLPIGRFQRWRARRAVGAGGADRPRRAPVGCNDEAELERPRHHRRGPSGSTSGTWSSSRSTPPERSGSRRPCPPAGTVRAAGWRSVAAMTLPRQAAAGAGYHAVLVWRSYLAHRWPGPRRPLPAELRAPCTARRNLHEPPRRCR